jgi:predicted AlkP superfamily pyrophosphatase or phosphodiesterase
MIILRALCGFVLVLLAVSSHAPGAERHVVVISIDGLPAYLIDDPMASLPVLRGLIARGVVAKAGMRVSNPSVTWPNHTTLMTGVNPETHGVIFNGLPERQGVGKPVKLTYGGSQKELVRVPLLFDVLKTAGKSSAAINWPCTRDSVSIDDNFPDVPDELRYTTSRLKAELEAAGKLANFEHGGGVVRDEVWTEAACRIIRGRKPSLLVLHILNLDGTHHKYGPKSPPGYTAAALTDALVGRVLDAIEDAGLRDSTDVFIVSDHGFARAPKSLRPNVVLRKAGLLQADDRGRVNSAKVHVIPEGGIGMVYLTDPDSATSDRETAKRLFEGLEGVAAMIGPEDFPRYHLPAPVSHQGMADMILACKEGYSVGGSAAGDELVVDQDGSLGVHGYLSTEPLMRAVFIASGPGIKRGLGLDTVDNVDVAPTVARILDVSLPGTSGHALTEIFDSVQ